MPTKTTILAVDDDALSLGMLGELLRQSGYRPLLASDAEQALAMLGDQPVDLIVSDLVMPGMDGMALLKKVAARHPAIPFVVITAYGSIGSAVEAMQAGAADYLEKPFNPDALRLTIRRVLEYRRVVHENEQIKTLLQEHFTFQNIVTANAAMRQTLSLAARVAAARQTTVAIYGESGVGKEVLARAIHFAGDSSSACFITVNCAAIPEQLLESELFGHVRGAFTGADRDREGKFSRAKGGTILLDEIGDMPLALQAKLLRVLQERVYEQVGGNRLLPADCRVIVATNRNLAALVAAGRFREDLYHRVNVFPLTIPPLRERREDIPLLCEHTVEQLRQHLGKPLPGISQKAMQVMLAHDWRGNVRELRNCLERAAILTDDELIRPEHLGLMPVDPDGCPAELAGFTCYRLKVATNQLSLNALTQQILQITLERCGGNKSQAAKLLGITRKNFYRS
jgi:DNA-binding NtrC family response regulator